MPYSSLPTVVAGQTIAASWGNQVDTNLDSLENPPACRVYNSANISVAHNTAVAVTFDSERYDTDGMHSTSTNTGRITFTTAGLYIVWFGCRMAAASDYTFMSAQLRVNGATFIGLHSNVFATGTSIIRDLTVSTVYKFAAADYVEVLVQQNNGAAAARNITAAAAYSPEFTAVRLGAG